MDIARPLEDHRGLVSQGRLIALEGIDGSGTTSQGKRVADALRARGLLVHLTAEPSTGPVGQLIRRVLHGEMTMTSRTLAMLYATDRMDHLDREVLPALHHGATVLTDRYLLSSLAYQALDNPLSWVLEINHLARPADLNLLLRVSPETAAARRAARAGPEERFDAQESQRRIAALYDEVFARPDVGRCVVIDGEDAPDRVEASLLRHLDVWFASGAEARP